MIEIGHKRDGAFVTVSAIRWPPLTTEREAEERLALLSGETAPETIERLEAELKEVENELADTRTHWRERAKKLIAIARWHAGKVPETRDTLSTLFEFPNRGHTG